MNSEQIPIPAFSEHELRKQWNQQADEAAGGGGVTETATITVRKIRDGDGRPTCCWEEEQCPFLLYTGFGTRESCFLLGLDVCCSDSGELDRRNHRNGSTIPHDRCPVWHGEEVVA